MCRTRNFTIWSKPVTKWNGCMVTGSIWPSKTKTWALLLSKWSKQFDDWIKMPNGFLLPGFSNNQLWCNKKNITYKQAPWQVNQIGLCKKPKENTLLPYPLMSKWLLLLSSQFSYAAYLQKSTSKNVTKKINLGRLEKPVVIAKKPFPLEIL